MTPIGVDEWVARSDDRRDQRGWRGRLGYLDARFGWWQRLLLVGLAAFVYGEFVVGGNVNYAQTGFNVVLYAILALGLNIAVGWAGLLDLGYIAFFGAGAYGYALFSSHAFGNLPLATGGVMLPAIASIPIAVAGVGILGMLIGLVALRLSGDYFAIVTLFVGQAFAEAANNVAPGTLGGANGLFGLQGFHVGSAAIGSTLGYYWYAVILLVVLMALLHLLDSSRTGRAWRAVRDDSLAASAMTISVNKVKVMAFAFGAVVAALAGTMFAAQQSSVFATNFSAQTLILIYACLVLGGAGSIGGAVLGGVVVTVAQQLLSSPIDSAYLFYGIILIVLIARVRPWQYLAAVLAAIVGFGVAAHAIVAAISHRAVAGSPGSAGWFATALRHYVIVPRGEPLTYGNILYIAAIVMVIVVVQLKGIRRLIAVVPTVYVGVCCWEARLTVDPGITAQIMIGAILIVTMAARPEGLLGTRRVEVV
ncbi:MAG TPA: branched-chain amino acid ABC transporter permease [Solirubrobacteraceae bacterium]